MFAPVITIVLFTIIAMANGTTLDIKTAFPTIAVLALVTHSANMVMTVVPQAIAACASFAKIEDYIKSQKAPAISHSPRPAQLAEGSEVSIQGLTVQWTPEGSPTLKDINLELLRGQVVACLGPVGAGKSTLARAILGKVPLTKSTIRHRTESIAYCAQVPWLPNRTIRQVICGSMAKYNVGNEWYRAVIRSCCLDQDLAVLPDGDQTVAGADGMNLSGGQRQRVVRTRRTKQNREWLMTNFYIFRPLRVPSFIVVIWWCLMIRSALLMERQEIKLLKTFLGRRGFSDS